ncbi:MAG: Hsp20/alpha crystallin family protein [Candidatus Rokubacteria bacterium]|nr:Hsp20/alpha crystallin family protein [Candidatus Rokubacteria bacterium]
MALEVWRPRKGLMRSPVWDFPEIERGMEEMFNRFMGAWPWPAGWGRGWVPAVDVVERKDEVVLRADLPGLEQKDIEVTVQSGMLTIRGERKEEKEEKDEEHYYHERAVGTFERTVPVPPGVEEDKIRATFKNGVLEVHLQKSKEAKGKKIEIKAA